MRVFSFIIKGVSLLLYWISCAAVACIVSITVFDVIMRRAGHPVDFAVEIVILLAGVVIACAFPATSLSRNHVIMEFIEGKLSGPSSKVVNLLTRSIGMALFVTIGFGSFKLGNEFRNAGQCSPILQIPEFPLPFILGIACFVECLVLVYMFLADKTKEEEPL